MPKSLVVWPRIAERGLLAALLIAILTPAVSSRAGELTDTADFAEVGAAVVQYAHKYDPARILLVLDIDNTLLAMNTPLGSDQWFEWQRFMLDNDPKSKFLVADSFPGLLEVQGLLFSIAHMHPPQPNLPGMVRRLQQLGIHTLVLTSRGPEFRNATERELHRNGYDLATSELQVHDLPRGEYLPYDLDQPEAGGLTAAEVKKFHLLKPRPISYENGILMTAGQNKAAMLLALLHDVDGDVDAVVYDDDNILHVAAAYSGLLDRGKEVSAFHYTREDANVKRFQYGNKEDVNRRWKQLSNVLEEVLQ